MPVSVSVSVRIMVFVWVLARAARGGASCAIDALIYIQLHRRQFFAHMLHGGRELVDGLKHRRCSVKLWILFTEPH
jgi:hypothetical protein